ncbi:MAG TPA: TonB-dependent receptor, partial [Vicinamibacterales bacterium]|nr:TonB-dependent receptor [Vicinamibacterales bacterium]
RHSEFGTFVSPRVSALFRQGPWSSRISYGTGFFAPSAVTEETEAAGLSRLTIHEPLKPERGRSLSVDLTRTTGPLTTTLTVFHSRILDPVEVDRTGAFVLHNLAAPTTNAGIEALAVWKDEDFSLVANYAYIYSREDTESGRAAVPLTPAHAGGIDAAWDWGNHEAWHAGAEWYFTGRQRLEANPYRETSASYSVFGLLLSRRIGRTLLYINGENLNDVRQTDWDPLLRQSRSVDGRWTVDAWAPLDGRVINGGLRISF